LRSGRVGSPGQLLPGRVESRVNSFDPVPALPDAHRLQITIMLLLYNVLYTADADMKAQHFWNALHKHSSVYRSIRNIYPYYHGK